MAPLVKGVVIDAFYETDDDPEADNELAIVILADQVDDLDDLIGLTVTIRGEP
jgi:hypothetical protein